ncbi:MAG: hypothetical protein AB8H79_23280 [Myxococcota bacterium]
MSEDEINDLDEPGEDEAEDRPRVGLRRRLQRLMDRRDLAEDTREMLGGMLEMSDRAKNEAVRLVAREARNYLEELRVKEEILDLVTSHSLELKMSVHLKPLADAMRDSDSAKSTPDAAASGTEDTEAE